ncbi:restriction endonuclease subunit S [Acinetobacter baumannii]|nr:restriction endonuclease subunit S [Acinetobacter baumannii]
MAVNIPANWALTTFGELAYIRNGYAFKSSFFSNVPKENHTIPLVKQSQLVNQEVDLSSAVYLPDEFLEKYNAYKLEKGDILIGMSGSIGKVCRYETDIPSLQNQRTGKISLRSANSLNNNFFGLFLSNLESTLVEKAKGMGVQNISAKDIEELSFYLPPFAEQQKIVEKVEELFSEIDDGIQSLETAKKQLDVYRHAILTAAFNGELTDKWRKKNPQLLLTTENLLNQLKDERKEHFEKQLKNWENEIKVWAKNDSDSKKPRKPKSPSLDIKYYKNEKLGVSIPLYELHLQVFDGPFGSNLKTADYTESGIPVVRLENIQFLEFITDKQAFISHEKYEILKKHTVKPNDIIFSSFIGEQNRVALIPPSIPKAINKADCFCIRNLSKLIEEKFILYFLASRDAYKQIEDEVHGVGRQRINTTQLKNIYLPIVSIDEQREIIAIIEKAFESYSNLLPIIDSELKRLSNLKVSILQKAFSGQLVPQDPNDEPASVLLERIKAEKEEELTKAKANKIPKKSTKRKTKTIKEDEPAQQELI